MYIAIYLVLLAIAGFIAWEGYGRKKNSLIYSGLFIALFTIFIFWFMRLWGEKLWFDQTGFPGRFETEWFTKILLFIAGAIIGVAWILVFTLKITRGKAWLRISGIVAGIIISGFFWSENWETILVYLNAVETGTRDPILGMDTGFYLFSLPFCKAVFLDLLYLAIAVIVINILSGLSFSDSSKNVSYNENYLSLSRGFVNVAALLVIIGFGRYLHRFDLMYSGYGVVNGPGWTDANIRIPMLLVTSVLTMVTAVLILIPSYRKKIMRYYRMEGPLAGFSPVFSSLFILFGLWLILSGLLPWLFQWLKVEPNEITVEKPYIENNIRFTRIGFDLEKAEEYEYPATDVFNQEVIDDNKSIF